MKNENMQQETKKPVYKKAWFWVLVAAIVVIGYAVGNGNSGDSGKTVDQASSKGAAEASAKADAQTGEESGAPAEAENSSQADEDDPQSITGSTAAPSSGITIESQVLADSDGIKVTATGIEDSFLGPEIRLEIENTSDTPVIVQSRDVSINGIMMSSVMFSCEIAAGKSANDSLGFVSHELEMAGIETIGEIELKINVSKQEDWSEVFTTKTQQIHTSAYGSFEQQYDDSGFVAVDQDGCRVIIKKLEDKESFWGADIYVYVENNSDQDLTVQVRDVSINGYMVSPTFSCDVIAGKKAFDSITFFESDLEDNGIEDITEMELYFAIINKKTLSTIVDTDIIKVAFQS